MSLRQACLLLAVSAVLPACGAGSYAEETHISQGTFCTLEARPAVLVTVVDAGGNVQRDARVTFTRDGNPEQQAMCNGNQLNPQPPCDRWVTTYEWPGEYVITATSADGSRTGLAQVKVGETSDGCHVITETVRITLPD